jgi:MFS family permease
MTESDDEQRPLTQYRAFMQLWLARIASVSASQMLLVALGWQMYELTGSAWDLGLVGLAQFVPALVLTLPAGQWIDRHHRGRILAGCLAVQVAAAAALAWGSAAGWMSREALLAVSVVLGALRALQMPTQQALTPLLVPAVVLPRALAFSSAGLQGAIIAGPALGGFVYVAGAAATYACCAALFVVATALVAQPVVLGALILDMVAVLLGGVVALLPIYAKDILQVGPWGLGLLRAAPALGALAMSLWLTRWPLRQRVGSRLLQAVAVYGAAMAVFGLSSHFGLSLVALAITGAADMVSVVIRQTLVQLETPDTMRGRVSAVNSLFIGASNQLGEFRAGAMAAVVGPVASAVIGSLGVLAVAALWPRWFPALARRDRLLPDGTPGR